MNATKISAYLRILFSIVLLIASGAACIKSFREGDQRTGWLTLVVFIMALLYAWVAIKGKKGFGRI